MTSRRQLYEERVARTSRRMSLGSLGGRTEQAQPQGVKVVAATKARASLEVATFTVIGDMAVGLSPKYRVMRGGAITIVTFEATAAGTGTTTFRVLDDGVVRGSSISVTSSTTEQETVMASGLFVSVGSKLRIEITAAGMHDEAVIQVALAT